MKKLLLSVFGFAAMMASANAQTYFSEDFTAGAGAFTTVDADGDGNDWGIADYATGNGEGNVMTSASWATNPLTPDNWLISPAIDLTTATGVINLEWLVYAQDQAWVSEYYDVYVSTTNTPAAFTAAGSVFNETLTTSAGYMARSVNVSAFAGQTVYVAYRHYNSTDWFRINLDEIVVKTPLNDDAVMTSMNLAPFGTGGNEAISGVITNNGGNDITSFDISYTVDGGAPVVQNFVQTITAGNTYNFNCATPLAAVAGNSYNVEVTVVAANDADGSNNMLAASHTALTSIPTKVVVGEEKTGTWCGFCPRGAVGLAGMEATSDFIGIAVHNSDPMAIANYDAGTATYHPDFTGYPHGAVDRVIGGDPSTFNTMHPQRASAIVPCAVNNITAIYNQATSMISVSADADFVGNVTGEFRMSCVIIEDDIQTTGNGWDQVNYYTGNAYGPLVDPVSGFAWHTAADPVAPTAFGGYDHVAISLSNNDILGDAGSLTMNPTIGTQNHAFADIAGSVVTDQTMAKSHAVVMIVNAATGEIVNAGISTISVVTSTEKIADAKFALTVFPNPTVDNAVVSFNLETANNVKMEVYNAMGALVYTKDAGNLATGNHTMAFNGSELNSGFYFVNLTIGNNVITKKVTLSK